MSQHKDPSCPLLANNELMERVFAGDAFDSLETTPTAVRTYETSIPAAELVGDGDEVFNLEWAYGMEFVQHRHNAIFNTDIGDMSKKVARTYAVVQSL
jgi:hypothetical protein